MLPQAGTWIEAVEADGAEVVAVVTAEAAEAAATVADEEVVAAAEEEAGKRKNVVSPCVFGVKVCRLEIPKKLVQLTTVFFIGSCFFLGQRYEKRRETKHQKLPRLGG